MQVSFQRFSEMQGSFRKFSMQDPWFFYVLSEISLYFIHVFSRLHSQLERQYRCALGVLFALQAVAPTSSTTRRASPSTAPSCCLPTSLPPSSCPPPLMTPTPTLPTSPVKRRIVHCLYKGTKSACS